MKPTPRWIALLLAVFFSACSGNSGAPSEAEARIALEGQIQDFSQGCVKLVEFHKTGERDLGQIMLVETRAEIEFLEDCNWLFDSQVMVLKPATGETPNARKGERRTVDLTLQFQKTSQGWMGTRKEAKP